MRGDRGDTIYASVLIVSIIIFFLIYTKWKKAYASQMAALSCLIIFVIQSIFEKISFGNRVLIFDELAFNPLHLSSIKVYTLLTHMYLHSNVLHIIMNVFILILVGVPFEDRIGPRKFFFIYILTGVAGAFTFTLFHWNENIFAIGASGAIFGIMGAFVALYPKDEIAMFLFFIFLPRVKVVIAVTLLVLLESAFVALGRPDGVAHTAHLGGFIAGFAIARLIPHTKKEVKKPLDLGVLRHLVRDARQEELLNQIMGEDEEDVRHAWLDYLINTLKCPECGKPFLRRGRKLSCDCGYEVKF